LTPDALLELGGIDEGDMPASALVAQAMAQRRIWDTIVCNNPLKLSTRFVDEAHY